ncbi:MULTISPECIES: hypothetical protein [Pseudomonas]|uniref:Uncharacterized protein n=1 Tax=Pseudomonas hunanensis TaxID=1247546 RepID=A0ACC9MYG0_9PSED|nr:MULTISPECIES: hypothetical protein [Pseudomonas]AGN82263.1 hypothetical protein L483_15045 [Pseudomonas putida H8234]MBP2086311.1 hypothetical protein [Pseudomonas sp. PvP089]MBP2092701.1 hypothetical protein [Pseudomonas sp. PvP088]MBP2226481.1 hypothetical protein [Pseudomonas putida]MCE1021111.1 hypothetical protein [Pseudomonas monteilii]
MSQKIQATQTAVLIGDREQGTMLAALRHYQEFLRSGASAVPGLLDIASNAGQLPPLSTQEIEVLCEKVNFGSTVKELESFVANAKAK